MKLYVQRAPHGVTVIQLDNGDEALYLHGECLACADMSLRDDSVTRIGQNLADVLGVPFRLLTLPVPEDDEWSWNDITDSLDWGKRITVPRMVLRPVLECCINHMPIEDHFILESLGFYHEDSGWLMNTGVGYLIRLDAVTRPLHRLKRLGISRATRAFIFSAMRQADASMIHFSAVGEEVDGALVFDW